MNQPSTAKDPLRCAPGDQRSAATTRRSLSLRDLLARHRDNPWLFVRPGGNWGDQLIYAGAEKLASDLGIRWTTHDSATFAAAKTSQRHCIYLHGGGGYNTWGSGRPFRLLAQAVSCQVELVVQGPQTLAMPSDALVDRLGKALSDVRCSEVVFFAREATSLRVLESLRLPLASGLDHDTAFHLQRDDILKLASLTREPARRYALTAYRDDDEKPQEAGSTLARGVVLDPAYEASSFAHWLRIHLYASELLTNRVHSSVLGAILGIPVTLAPGSYHKNRSIWSYSLAGRGVQWCEGIRTEQRLWQALPNRLRDSYKLRKLRLWWLGLPLQ